jgi:hypothetical protein
VELIYQAAYHPQNGAVRIRADILGSSFVLHIQGAPEPIYITAERPIEIQVANHNGAILLSVDGDPNGSMDSAG